MGFGQRFAMYGGLGLVAFASVGLSVVLTRLYSAALGSHLAFLAVSLALFGVGVGGGLVALVPSLAKPPSLFKRMSFFSAVASVTSIVALIKTLVTKAPEALDGKSTMAIVTLYALSALPFTAIGVVVAAALKNARGFAARIYFADMLGAAAGGSGALLLLRLGAPRAGLVLAIVLGVASVVFALGSLQRRGTFSDDEARGGGWTAAAILASGIALFCGDYGEQWLTVRQLRYVNLDRAQFIGWNELALVTVDKPAQGMAWMRVDASAATAILAPKTRVDRHPAEMAYVLHGSNGPTLVLGAGGGREVKAALDAGQTQVVAVEINRTIANDVMLDKMKDFSGGLYAREEVELVVADARSYVRGSDWRYRNIVLSLVDTWAASSVGGMALVEDGLYTVESFRDLIAHLEDDGVLVVNRHDFEFERLLSLSTAALMKSGVADPRAHLFGRSHDNSSALLVSRRPLSEEEIAQLRNECRRFKELFAPDRSKDPLYERIVQDPWAASREVRGRDISPPTDERPFFFYTVPPRELLTTLKD